MISTLLLSVSLAQAGYGDAVDGFPLPEERALHAWTNAARMDPAAFRDAYNCPMREWAALDQQPQRAFGIDLRLVEAARLHSEDMVARGYFAHDTPEGVDPFDRMAEAGYPMVTGGENIQTGASQARDAMLGWMCSTGHRENIMYPDFHHLGAGYAPAGFGGMWTQNFGATSGGYDVPAIAMAADESRSDGTLLLANVQTTGAPEAVVAVVGGREAEMVLGSGRPAQGTWRAVVDPGPGCHLYWIEAELADGETARFPETGAYGIGSCGAGEVDDVQARWASEGTVRAVVGGVTREELAAGAGVGDETVKGCGGADVSGGMAGVIGWMLVLIGVRRRSV